MAINTCVKQTVMVDFVNKAWNEVTRICKNYRGVDGFNKGICDHSQNSSFGFLEDRPGFMRCSILSCPHKDRTYDLAKKMQHQGTTCKNGLDLFRERRPHLRVVKTA